MSNGNYGGGVIGIDRRYSADPLVIKKLIYPRRVSQKHKFISNDLYQSIFKLEIDEHLRKNPGIEFSKFGEVERHSDLTETHTMLFKLRETVDVHFMGGPLEITGQTLPVPLSETVGELMLVEFTEQGYRAEYQLDKAQIPFTATFIKNIDLKEQPDNK